MFFGRPLNPPFEIGYLPIDAEDAKLFFQLIDMRYEKKSTIHSLPKFNNQNHQCELVVCSAARSLCCQPKSKRPTEWFPFCITRTR
ncbi:hypothetical protein CAI16_19330 [Virgibacillus dokdonensis]|uniref:IstB-like ATP-binding domain-containing protein n=1 Tax=Virgibacillus dokdonensis TaxID=302167 RepID=A0A3E0WID8_9BACI|nr:hypothetical protein CAI16_19330 [Virgibacillus dokdonensis]